MAVFRVERNKGYTVMSNHHLRNKELSLKAKGLLSQMLSLPEDWDYTLAGLSFINREKIDAIREAVKELERAGYIVRSRERDEKGRLRGTDYVIFEQPQTPPVSDLPTLENPTLDNPTLEKPTQEKPTLENPMQLNKDIQKTDLPKKEKSNTDLSSTDSIPIHSLNPLPYDGEAATPPERKRKEATDAYSVYEEIIKDNIEYDHFVRYGQVDKDRLDENSMNITYTQNGDYLIPNIIIRKTKPLGHYGRLRKAYLEMHRPILFNELVLSDKLFEHCAEIDEAARNRMELIVRSLAEQNGVTEQLKAENQMEWVRQMNACKTQAEEIVKAELIYD